MVQRVGCIATVTTVAATAAITNTSSATEDAGSGTFTLLPHCEHSHGGVPMETSSQTGIHRPQRNRLTSA